MDESDAFIIRCISIKLFIEFSCNFTSLLYLMLFLASFFFILDIVCLFHLVILTEDFFFLANQLYTVCFVCHFVNF